MFDEADRLSAESVWVLGDGALLIRALVNLLSNAIRYSESDSMVRVAVCTEGSNPQWFICRIIDGGRGMSNEQLARLNLGLQPIPHTQGTQPDAVNSLGVGFARARTVIMRHQGYLVVESELGRGTTVIVRLPLSLSE